MKKLEYCRLEHVTQEQGKEIKLHSWVAFLFTTEGLAEMMRSDTWIEKVGLYAIKDDSHHISYEKQRIIMISRLGSEGWEWIERSGFQDTFQRSKDE